MCPKGALLRSKGDQTATCPGCHVGCITIVDKLESLSEYESGCEIGRDIADAVVTVVYCTIDRDSHVVQSIQETNPSHQVKRLADLVHLSQTQAKRAKKRIFSLHPFSGVTKKKDRQECRCVLAAVLKNRSSMILEHMSEKVNADTDQMKYEMPSVINAVLQCHGVDCSDCVEKSAGICAGVTVTTGLLGLANSGRMASLPCTQLE